MIESHTVAAVGVIALWLSLPADWLTVNPSERFGRRWDGGCTGWENALSIRYCLWQATHWFAYVNIAFALWRLHPTLKGVWQSKVMLPFAVMFFITCGGSHLLDAYAVFNPVYPAIEKFLLASAIVSYIGSFFIAWGLVRTFAVVLANRKRYEKMDRRLDKMDAG